MKREGGVRREGVRVVREEEETCVCGWRESVSSECVCYTVVSTHLFCLK